VDLADALEETLKMVREKRAAATAAKAPKKGEA
jgi:hypothetical protein